MVVKRVLQDRRFFNGLHKAFGFSLALVVFGCASAVREFGSGGDGGSGGVACGPGTTSCSGDCVDTDVDPANCGSCGNTCPQGQVCASGICSLSCAGGTTKCGNLCVNTSLDPANCGACGNVCGSGVCQNGMCILNCMSGQTPCGNVCVDLNSDPANCGTCGNTCAVNESCSSGVCSNPMACNGGAVLESTAPSGTMVVCDHPADTVCEQDAETLCPTGWGLCSYLQHNARKAGWNYQVGLPATVIVGEIYCRTSGAGHFTIPDSGNQPNTLGGMVPFNCYYGSSRPSCTAAYGCNEQYAKALCCAPTPTCGNGVVDSPEEDCDDGNSNESDDCLNSCSWRIPSAHGYMGTNCG